MLNGAMLSAAICGSLGVTDPDTKASWDKIANEIVKHIVTNAIVAGGVCAPNGPVVGAKIT